MDTQTNWIEIWALLIGPVAAVLITLAWETVRRGRERKMQILQTVMALSATPSNPFFTNAINAAELEFQNSGEVLNARRAFLEEELPASEVTRRLDALVWSMMKALGMKVPKAPLPRERFYAAGLGQQEQLLRDALEALPRLAKAAETSAAASHYMAVLLTQQATGQQALPAEANPTKRMRRG